MGTSVDSPAEPDLAALSEEQPPSPTGDVERLCDRFACSEKATLRRIETVIG